MNKIFSLFSVLLFSLISQAQLTINPAPSSGEIVLSSANTYIYFSNPSASILPMSLALSSNSNGVSISLNRCGTSLKANSTCYILVSFPSYATNSQLVSLNLLNNSSPLSSLKFNPTVVIPQTSNFNMSSLVADDFTSKIFVITNKTSSTKSYSPVISGTDASKYSITINRCSSIPANGTCQVYVKLNPQEVGSYSASITEPQVTGSISLSSSITLATAGVIIPPNPSISVSPLSVSFGTILNLGATSSQVVTIMNNGNIAVSPIINVAGTGLSISLNRCLILLGVNQSCQVSLVFNAISSMTNGVQSGLSLSSQATLSTSLINIPVSATLNIAPSLLTSSPANSETLTLSALSLVEGQNIYESNLITDTDGKKKLVLNGTCTKNNESVKMILDEFEGEEFDGMPKTSIFCDLDYNCTSDASLTTQCLAGQYQFKVPIQEISDFWYWLPYGGLTHLKIEYESVVSENVISLNFNNYSSPPYYYRADQIDRTVDPINLRQVSENSGIKYYAADIRLGTWMYGSRYNNPRNISESLLDYPMDIVDSSSYPNTGEIKISLNNSCTGGTWQKGFSQEPNVFNYAKHFYALTYPLSLPTNGDIQEISIQGRDLVTGQYSVCSVKKFAYQSCPDTPMSCASSNYTVDFPNIYIF